MRPLGSPELGLTPNLSRRLKQEIAGDPAFPGKGTAQISRIGARPTEAGLGARAAGAGFFKTATRYFAKPSP